MRWLTLTIAALLLAGLDAIKHRASNSTILAADHLKVMKSQSALFSEMRYKLAIMRFGNPELNLDESDQQVKDEFVEECKVNFAGGGEAEKSDIVQDMCSRAGGDSSECDGMVTGLVEARAANDLTPWCDSTFDWFAAKTRPKCFSTCQALLCKNRCSLQDKYDDLSENITAHQAKLDVLSAKQERVQKQISERDELLANITELKQKKCIDPNTTAIELEENATKLGQELESLNSSSFLASFLKDKARDDLTRMKEEGTALPVEIENAEELVDERTEGYKVAKDKESAKNEELKAVNAELVKLRSLQEFNCNKAEEMKAEYDADASDLPAELRAVAAEKAEIQTSMDNLESERAPLEAALANPDTPGEG